MNEKEITTLLDERAKLIHERNADAEVYLSLIDKVRDKIDRAANAKKLMDMEGNTNAMKERLREIDRKLRELGYTGELTSGC